MKQADVWVKADQEVGKCHVFQIALTIFCLLVLGYPTGAIAQITSVSELSDVQPTDWAFQALQSLVERYGVIAGYPDGTFKGNRPLTRYEFAAGLNAVADRIDELIAAGLPIDPSDLQTLQRLQRDYRQDLAQVRSRLNTIESRITNLENEQFSTTTKLDGEAVFALTDGSKNATLVSRVQLNFLTSFHANDLLVTQLEAGNNGRDSVSEIHERGDNLLGTAGILADGGGLDYIESSQEVELTRLYYTFRPRSDLTITVGAKMVPSDFIDRNRFANDSTLDFNSSFFVNNPLIVQNQIDEPGGAGAAINWQIGNSPFSFNALYIAADANLPEQGFFDSSYQGSLELAYAPTNAIAVRLQYTNASINDTEINAFGVNAEWSINRFFGAFGRFGTGRYNGFNTALDRDLDLEPTTWALGVAIRDFIIPGTAAGLAIGQPFVESDLGDATQTNFEVFYNLALSDRLSVTPSLILVNHADNNRSSGLTWQGTLRTIFSF